MEEENDKNISAEIQLCFLCCSVVKNSQGYKFKTNQLLSNNLNVVFLLKNLLHLPETLLISYLKENGDPNNWMINLCESCEDLTLKALEYHWEIIKCQQKLVSTQTSIIDKIKSLPDNQKGPRLTPLPINSTTWQKTREFVKKHDYKLVTTNPFLDGDKLARNLVERLVSISNDQISPESNPNSPVLEVDTNDDFQSDDDNNYIEGESDPDDDDSEWEQELKPKEKPKSTQSSNLPVGSEIPKMQFRDWSKYKRVNGKIKCNYCEKVFSRRKGVLIHEDEFHCKTPGQFVCDICGKAWNTYTRLRQHKRDVHNMRPDGSAIKTVIGQKDESNGKPKRRKRSSNEIPKEKKVPTKPVRDWSKYEKVNGKIKCKFCDKVFSQKKGARIHEDEFHCDNPGQFVCDICGSKWNTHTRLRQHKRDAHSVRPDGSSIKKVLVYTCHVCGKQLPSPSKLSRHLRKHKEKM